MYVSEYHSDVTMTWFQFRYRESHKTVTNGERTGQTTEGVGTTDQDSTSGRVGGKPKGVGPGGVEVIRTSYLPIVSVVLVEVTVITSSWYSGGTRTHREASFHLTSVDVPNSLLVLIHPQVLDPPPSGTFNRVSQARERPGPRRRPIVSRRCDLTTTSGVGMSSIVDSIVVT